MEIHLCINRIIFFLLLTNNVIDAYISLERPKILIAPQNTSILANHQTFFICIPEGNPKPKVIWLYNKKPQLPERYNLVKESVLQLSSARSDDNGALISCVCRNVMGSVEKSAFIKVYNDINVVPKGFPKYLGKSSIIVSQKNSNVTLECLVVGQPQLNVIWFKNYYPLDLRSIRYQLINERNLLIVKVTESDTAKYHCMAINEHGSTFSPAKNLMIRVSQYSPHFLYVSPDQYIRTGSSVKLKCTGEGSPTPTVYWICENTKLTGHSLGSDQAQSEFLGSIEMILSDISESLNCTCVAKTPRETANHTVHITVKNLPIAPKIVRISTITARSCLLTWKYQPSASIPISSFSVFYIPTRLLRIEQPFSKTIDISVKEMFGSDFEINTKIADIKPFTNYSLWLVTNGGEGVSEPSKIQSFTTLEAEPSTRVRSIAVSLLNETSVRIKWKSPIESNGKIISYNIFYSKRKDLNISLWPSVPLHVYGNNQDENSIDIFNLDQNTMYYFSINSRNRAGTGPVSYIIPKYINDKELYQLTNLTLLSVLSDSADISWKMNEIIKVHQFQVICTPSKPLLSEKPRKLFVNKANKQSIYFITLSNLIPNTIYSVEIIPIENEQPKFSTKLKLKTHITGDYREAVKASSISQESIMISISRDFLLSSSKTEIRYHPYGESNKTRTKTCHLQSESICYIDKLIPETLYQLDIQYRGKTVNRYVETWSKAPDPIVDLQLELVAKSPSPSIRATWKYKTKTLPKFEISYYPVNVPKSFRETIYSKTFNVSGFYFESDPRTHVMGSTVEFSVKAIANSQVSESVHARLTLPDGVPSGYPKNLTDSVKQNENFVSLSWILPDWDVLNGQLKSNEIACYLLKNMDLIFKKNVTENYVHIAKNIFKKNVHCRIRSRTKVGAGPWSPFTMINYIYAVVEAPSEINVIQISPCCLKISWKWKAEFLDFYSYFLIFLSMEDRGILKKMQLKTKYASSLFYVNQMDKILNYSIVMQSVMKNGRHSEFSRKQFSKLYSKNWPTVKVKSPLCLPINSRKIKIKWTYHYKIENLSHFRINFTGVTHYTSNTGIEVTMMHEERENSALYDPPSIEYEKELNDLLPNSIHYIDIEPIQIPEAKTFSESTRISCITSGEPPRDVPELKIGQVDRENFVIQLVLNQPSFEYGPINNYFIVVDSNYPPDRDSKRNMSDTEASQKSPDMIFNFLARVNRSQLSKQQLPYIAAEINATLVMKEILLGKVFLFPLGCKRTANTYPTNVPLVKGTNYRAALIACISPYVNGNTIKDICSMSKWSEPLNPLTSVPYVTLNIPENKSLHYGENNILTTNSILSKVILTSIFIPIIICSVIFFTILILKRQNVNMKISIPCLKFRNSNQNYYPASNSEIKENLVNPLIVSNNAGSSYSNQNHDSLELKRYQISTTPDLLVKASPSTSYKETKMNINKDNFKQYQHKIPIGLLQEYIFNLKANDNCGFSAEFESIDHANQFSWEQSNKPSNKSKNRYANVVAYDHSRVVLQNSKFINDIGDSVNSYISNDYINANYINGYRKQNAYIATQGPLIETINDFWRMIWEQRSVIIVMITLLMERSRVKCEQYWPKASRGTQSTYGEIIVILSAVQEMAYYVCRSIIIQKIGSSEKREIKHFQFTAWPDHGVPQCTIPFLMFINRTKKEIPLDSGPIVVHCSAGVGRSGVFIAVDAMLEQLKHEKSVDIYSYVTHIRSQRNYMVQTEEQYVFIHEVLLDYFNSVNTEITSQQLYSHVEKLSKIEYEKAGILQFTGFQLEYRRLLRWSSLFSHLTPSTKSECSTKSSDSTGCQLDFCMNNYETASLMVNQSKNRSPYSLPPDINRVTLCPIRGVEGSDYINASWIDGYRYKKSYIATQCPIKETTEDFWRMLWEHNCGMVVTLNYVPECTQYWPNERSARYQFFVVDPIVEYQMSHFIMREFKLTDARDGQSRVMRQFQFTNWIDDTCIPVSVDQLLELIDQVQKTKDQFGQNGPLTVHCNSGSTRTGIFLVLSILLEKLKTDNCVNIFETFKLLKWQRPSLIESEDQYQFCFAALLEYLTLYSDENITL